MAEAATKRCPRCGEVKPVGAFHKDSTKADGCNSACKACRAESYQYLSGAVAKGIESVDQLPSVLRSMAELQAAIESEKEVCRKRVALAKEYSRQASESWRALLVNWRRMLRRFASEQPGRKGVFFKRCEFGAVCFKDGKMTVTLDWIRAGLRRGKP